MKTNSICLCKRHATNRLLYKYEKEKEKEKKFFFSYLPLSNQSHHLFVLFGKNSEPFTIESIRSIIHIFVQKLSFSNGIRKNEVLSKFHSIKLHKNKNAKIFGAIIII